MECKWRSRLGIYAKSDLLTDEKQDIYTRFSQERRMPVFIILGVGGVPCCPEVLYVIPLNAIPSILAKAVPMTDFMRPQPDEHFKVSDFLR